MNGIEKYQYYIVFFIIFISALMISYGVKRSLQLRKMFNFTKELRKVKNKMKKPNLNKKNSTLIGYHGKRPIFCADNSKHVFICGTTGSGKTIALSNYIKSAIEKDFPMLIIDGKGDTYQNSIIDIVNKLNAGNKKIYTINLTNIEQSDKYNPFLNASPTIAKDMLINMTDWSEEHYKLNAERYLQRLIMLMHKAEIKLTLKLIVKYMNLSKFTELSGELLKKGIIEKYEHLENVEICKTSGKISENSIARFSTIIESELGYIFDDNGIDIYTAIKQNAIIVFILNPLIYPEISQSFGRLILIDSKKAISKLFQNNYKRTFFIFDEINVYASKILIDLVNKSRSANVTCVLATQSLSDLASAEDEDFTQQIIENCNNYLVLRQNSAVNSENWANILGTKPTMEVTYQLQQNGLDTKQTGFGSAKCVREYLYHPDDIKRLQTGKGIYLSRDLNINSKLDVFKPF